MTERPAKDTGVAGAFGTEFTPQSEGRVLRLRLLRSGAPEEISDRFSVLFVGAFRTPRYERSPAALRSSNISTMYNKEKSTPILSQLNFH